MLGTIRIIPKTIFSLLGANPSTQTIPLLTRIRSADWFGGVLIVRFHSGAVSANTTLNIKVQNASYPEDDPSTLFLVATGVNVAQVQIFAGTAAGTLFTANLVTPGPSLPVILECVVSAATTQSTVGISIDVVGRPA